MTESAAPAKPKPLGRLWAKCLALVQTGGGAFINGSVHAAGDLVGRDQIINQFAAPDDRPAQLLTA